MVLSYIQIRELIEVAFFISRNVDAADAEETFGKEKMPKEKIGCRFFLGRTVKSCMTVIETDGALSEFLISFDLVTKNRPALQGRLFLIYGQIQGKIA